jgi:hypothetical protein
MTNEYCMGVECPVKNTCVRYVERKKAFDSNEDSVLIRKCTNQKKHIRYEKK